MLIKSLSAALRVIKKAEVIAKDTKRKVDEYDKARNLTITAANKHLEIIANKPTELVTEQDLETAKELSSKVNDKTLYTLITQKQRQFHLAKAKVRLEEINALESHTIAQLRERSRLEKIVSQLS